MECAHASVFIAIWPFMTPNYFPKIPHSICHFCIVNALVTVYSMPVAMMFRLLKYSQKQSRYDFLKNPIEYSAISTHKDFSTLLLSSIFWRIWARNEDHAATCSDLFIYLLLWIQIWTQKQGVLGVTSKTFTNTDTEAWSLDLSSDSSCLAGLSL